jgi:hypothetical protein
MDADFLGRIDWRRPWLAPVLPAAEPVLRAADWRLALNEAADAACLRNHRGLPIRFVAQSDLPEGVAYEAFISATGGVPTRDNLHDFFNALVWLTFPKTKVQLNALQAAEIAKALADSDGGLSLRGRVRDAATIFDENAALLITRDPGMADDLRAHRWLDVFVARGPSFWRDNDILLFGHALMEKLVSPYKAITAHARVLFAPDSYFSMMESGRRAWADAAMAEQMAGGLDTAGFMHLPIAGVPGWWEGQDAAFYADTTVFRPLPAHRQVDNKKGSVP